MVREGMPSSPALGCALAGQDGTQASAGQCQACCPRPVPPSGLFSSEKRQLGGSLPGGPSRSAGSPAPAAPPTSAHLCPLPGAGFLPRLLSRQGIGVKDIHWLPRTMGLGKGRNTSSRVLSSAHPLVSTVQPCGLICNQFRGAPAPGSGGAWCLMGPWVRHLLPSFLPWRGLSRCVCQVWDDLLSLRAESVWNAILSCQACRSLVLENSAACG